MRKAAILGLICILLLVIGMIAYLGGPSEGDDELSPTKSERATDAPSQERAGGWQAPHAAKLPKSANIPETNPPREAHTNSLSRVRAAQENLLAELTDKLQLTSQQADEVRERYLLPWQAAEARTARGTPARSGGPMPDLGRILATVLTAEQAATYRKWRTEQVRQTTASRVHQELSTLDFLDLSEDQREAVGEVIAKTTARQPTAGSTITMAESVGGTRKLVLDTVIARHGRGEIVQSRVAREEQSGALPSTEPTQSGPPSDRELAAQKARDAAIERDLARFAEILTPEQMARYREHLETNPSAGPGPPPVSLGLPALPE